MQATLYVSYVASNESSVLDQKVKLFKEFSRLAGPEPSERHDRRELDRLHGEQAVRTGWARPSRWA
jgi:hypothetical protein